MKLPFSEWNPQEAVPFIANHEGFSPTVYTCAGGRKTIGWGHCLSKIDPDDMEITKHQGEVMLLHDIVMHVKGIEPYVKAPLTRTQYIAFVSLVFNCGVNAIRNSTLLRMLNAEQYEEAGKQFLVWCRCGGEFNKGLYKRRQDEKALWDTVEMSWG